MEGIDKLPGTAKWTCTPMRVQGNSLDADGQPRYEDLELWYRDPLEVLQELLENPAASEKNVYEPCRIYRKEDRSCREYGEMWTGDWWWEVQVSILLCCYSFRTKANVQAETLTRRCHCSACYNWVRQDQSDDVQWRQTGISSVHGHWKHTGGRATPTHVARDGPVRLYTCFEVRTLLGQAEVKHTIPAFP
jgi:hypothetical protein